MLGYGFLLAQADDESTTPDKSGVESQMKDDGDYLNRWHDILSDRVESVGEMADRMFDPAIAFDEIIQTSIRLYFDTDAIEGESVEVDPKLDIKWVLPAAEGRLRLLLTSNDDEIDDQGNH